MSFDEPPPYEFVDSKLPPPQLPPRSSNNSSILDNSATTNSNNSNNNNNNSNFLIPPSFPIRPPPLPQRIRKNTDDGSYINSNTSSFNESPTPPTLPQRNYHKTSSFTPPHNNNPFRSNIKDNYLNDNHLLANTKNIDFNQPISNFNPLLLFPTRDHTLPTLFPYDNFPIQTNKYYGNMLLGNQQNPIWTHPYSLWYTIENYGIAANYVPKEQKVFDTENSIPRFFFAPTNIKSFIFTATDFQNNNQSLRLKLSYMDHMSCTINLSINNLQYLAIPTVQGMGMITTIYNNLQPRLDSLIGIKQFNRIPIYNNNVGNHCTKYSILLENNTVWTLYLLFLDLDNNPLQLDLINSNTIVANRSVGNCILQLTIADSSTLDTIAGNYPVSCQLKAYTTETAVNYSFHYSIISFNNLIGNNTSDFNTDANTNTGRILIFALPHHVDYLSSRFLQNYRTGIKLDSTVYGEMQGFITNYLQMVDLPVARNSSLELWPVKPIQDELILNKIKQAATLEIQNSNILDESNLDSMYFAGKILAKYAWLLYCCKFILNDENLTLNLLQNLKQAINRFSENKQKLPLIYDNTWKGIISSGDASQDFGNAFYNDHHFHYAYHVITSAIIVKVENSIFGSSQWYEDNKDWVESLIRDFANNSSSDSFFPTFRSFDWFNGHSWAKGLFESGDGKDEESSSEDVNASFALKLWGDATNNTNLSQIGSLQLSILKTSLNHYFLYSSENTTEPNNFIPNKVSGILFENKIDHTTYFGNNTEYIHMIHAIPIIPVSSFIRSSKFVQEEWDGKLKYIVDSVQDGWKGIIMLNLAISNPQLSYQFFANPNFNMNHLDPGQSLTWSLVYAASKL